MTIFEKKEINHTPHDLQTVLKSIPTLSETFKGTYIRVRDRWGYTARISSLLEMLQYSYCIEEWEVMDPRTALNGELQAGWMDSLVEYRDGKAIDFGAIWETIKGNLDFSSRELTLIETGSVDERLWAIYTLLLNQHLPIVY